MSETEALARAGVATCEFCGGANPAHIFVSTRHGLICDACVQVAVDVVMDRLTLAAQLAERRVERGDNRRPSRKLKVAA